MSREKEHKAKVYHQQHGLPLMPGQIIPWEAIRSPDLLRGDAFKVFCVIAMTAQKEGRCHDLEISLRDVEKWRVQDRTYRKVIHRLAGEQLIRVVSRMGKPPLIDLTCVCPCIESDPFRTQRVIEYSVVLSYSEDIMNGDPPGLQYCHKRYRA